MSASKTSTPYILEISVNGTNLEAHRIGTGKSETTGWTTETFAINYPQERGTSIDAIQLFFDPTDELWHHWPTKFVSSHKPIGEAVAQTRNNNPELKTYQVRIELHKHSDLSDRPTIKKVPSAGANPSDAVYRLRDQVNAERQANKGYAKLTLQSGSKRYIGNVLLTGVSG